IRSCSSARVAPPAQSFDPIAYSIASGAAISSPYSDHLRSAVGVHDEAESPDCAQNAGTALLALHHCASHESIIGRDAPTPAAVEDPKVATTGTEDGTSTSSQVHRAGAF